MYYINIELKDSPNRRFYFRKMIVLEGVGGGGVVPGRWESVSIEMEKYHDNHHHIWSLQDKDILFPTVRFL